MQRFAIRSLALTLLVGTLPACKDEIPKPPPRKVNKKVDTTRIPVPNHSPQAMSDPGKPRRAGVQGKMDAKVTGRMQHFTFFPRGQNAAVHFEDKSVSWMQITGALSDEGTPSLTFKIEPFNLGEAKLPKTFVVGEAKKGQPRLSAEYEAGPLNRWAESEGTDDPLTLTLESFEDHTVRGSFAGTLLPGDDEHEAVVLEDGTFEVTLRLTHVTPGTKAEPSP